ncbi:Mov34/MPN/PAD-1 family protein [Cycloclasticus pugetii]|jgi:integrative and conjugative element protein (TIGR02256 family)|uniref:Mov34/MPN/PAD-1 family protein n=1 Tax=Cycloclasticus pugetii TaxID=34068 RepID=UPI00091D0601|nr:Mov34/MPN/PAD-1 family protein [Cycloclasticus pugetii]MDF1829592.1 Mov34/MPN/PAD-1 family protein [Cycloclasticus pugetii]SHJ43144.1 integrative and conjugative element protein, VC0181 family [Cycloclasticus pugetii]|tara:strand:+ start:3784 stop:4290 length:507 start_codon:yes stop_codon:yes gene_type:complete
MFASDFEWEIEILDFGTVRVSSNLFNKLVEYRQLTSSFLESGGVLIGKHLNANGVLLIDDFTPPLPNDKQSRHRYYRSQAHCKAVRRIWKDSDHESTYVGLWHTHPEDSPNYSSIDKKDWLNALKISKFEGTRLFFIIIGKTQIRCWLGSLSAICNPINLVSELKIDS